MFIKEIYKSTRSLETKKIIFLEKFSSSDRKMDFYLTTSASTLPCFQIIWFMINASSIKERPDKRLKSMELLTGAGRCDGVL